MGRADQSLTQDTKEGKERMTEERKWEILFRAMRISREYERKHPEEQPK